MNAARYSCSLSLAGRVLVAAIFLVGASGRASAFEAGWSGYDAGGVTFAAPANMRAPANYAPVLSQVDATRPDWTFTLTDQPNNPAAGVMVTFNWSRNVTDEASGTQVLARGDAIVAHHQATRVEWIDSDVGWRGFGVVLRDVSPHGELFAMTCRSPQALWAQAGPVCEAILATVGFPATASPPAGAVSPENPVSGGAPTQSAASPLSPPPIAPVKPTPPPPPKAAPPVAPVNPPGLNAPPHPVAPPVKPVPPKAAHSAPPKSTAWGLELLSAAIGALAVLSLVGAGYIGRLIWRRRRSADAVPEAKPEFSSPRTSRTFSAPVADTPRRPAPQPTSPGVAPADADNRRLMLLLLGAGILLVLAALGLALRG